MSIALLVITDGRDHCITRTIPSALAMLDGELDVKLIYDDSGDDAHFDWLTRTYRPLGFDIIGGLERRGFGGAIRYAWQALAGFDDVDWIFHLEDDFTFNEAVPLARLQTVLDTNAHLAQVALRRQPWNDDEKRAGGIVEQHPDDYIDRSDAFGNEWLEHPRSFTTNPCLYRRSLCEHGWPDVVHSEGVFTHQLLAEGYRFAYWGARHEPPMVHHIGDQRVGCGY